MDDYGLRRIKHATAAEIARMPFPYDAFTKTPRLRRLHLPFREKSLRFFLLPGKEFAFPRVVITDYLDFSLAPKLLRHGLSWSVDSGRNMRIGRESAYAIEGLLALASQPTGTVLLLRDIAAARELPQSFLAKIFQKLARHGILASSRGAVRGYALARPSTEIKVREILIAVEGADFLDRCILWSDGCAKGKPCALHNRWKRAERIVGDLMDRTTLADLAREEMSETESEHAFI